MAVLHNDTVLTTTLPEIHDKHDYGTTESSIDEQHFIEAARAGKPVCDIDLARWYIKHYKLLRVSSYEQTDGIRRLTICHTWRIERHPDDQIRLFMFDLREGVWQEKDPEINWPSIPLISNNLLWIYDVVNTVCSWALVAARFKLPYHCHSSKRPGEYAFREFTQVRIPGSFEAGARALRAQIWEHIIERDVYSALMVMYKPQLTLVGYLYHARYRDGLLQVAKERRNLLPLLRLVTPQSWNRDDLFSRKLWSRNGRQRTALDRYPIKLRKMDGLSIRAGVYVPRPLSFAESQQWNWLRHAPVTIVRDWVEDDARLESVALFSRVGKVSEIRAPVIAWLKLLKFNHHFFHFEKHPEQIEHFVRLYLHECARIWREDGYRVVKRWIKSSDSVFNDLIDWLKAEGFAQGQPSKNATWASLQRRSDDWHRRIGIENLEKALGEENLHWESLIPSTVIDGIAFEPFDDAKSLALEGYEMRHCIGSYLHDCHAGYYRAYRVTEPDGARSTLGLTIKKSLMPDGTAGFIAVADQHRGKYNAEVSAKAKSAAEKLAKLYSVQIKASEIKEIGDKE